MKQWFVVKGGRVVFAGTQEDCRRAIIPEIGEKMMDADALHYVVRNGETVHAGSIEDCEKVVAEDTTGELEIYPASARIQY